MMIKNCGVCGKDYRVENRRAEKSKVCSLGCWSKFMRADSRLLERARDMGRKRKNGKTKKCKKCESEYYWRPSDDKRRDGKLHKRKYCSYGCALADKKFWLLRGEKHQNWKGGKITRNGYIYILSPNHPNRNANDRVAEHRLIMEQQLGRYLIRNEEVHHKNGIKNDNNIENLEIVIKKMHYGIVVCPMCQLKFKVR